MFNQRQKIEVADIMRKGFDKLNSKLSRDQWKVANAVMNCRTEALGGHKLKCDRCTHEEHSYNSCRNRHCPKCGGIAKARWLDNRYAELLPTEYFHVVFTVPDILNSIFLNNKKIMYNLFFKSVSETLKDAATNPKNLGANIGFFLILHTWGQNLLDHPHIHGVVPGGGLRNGKWISCKKGFFIHVRKLSELFKGKFLSKFKELICSKEFKFVGKCERFKNKFEIQKLLNDLYSKKWVTYSKPSFAAPKQVLKYLSNYTHRIAISNDRLIDSDEKNVSFKYKDYRDSKEKIMTITNTEFIRRFLLHTLPKGFVKIRFYGLLCNRSKKANIAICRNNLNVKYVAKPKYENTCWEMIYFDLTGKVPNKCPRCKKGILKKFSILSAFYQYFNFH